MKHYCKLLLFLSITIIAFYSCHSLGKISIQVAAPSKNPISSDIQNIAILNRSLNINFTNVQGYAIDKILISNKSFEKTFFDSIAADTAIKVAANAIFASQRFDVVIPMELNILRRDSLNLSEPLDSAVINQLCKDFKVDGILILESFSEKINGDMNWKESNYFQNLFSGVINLNYNLEWRLYQKQQSSPVFSFAVKDVIYWDSGRSYHSPREAYEKLPTIKDALIGGGIASGLDAANQICPKWVDEMRCYFITGNKEIDAAIPLIEENRWDEAKDHWTKYSSASNPSLRSKIEFNLALTEEMTGNMDLAVEWVNKSLKSKYSREAEDYLFNLSRCPINQNRYYYTTGNQEIDAAVPLIKLNNWDEATKILMKYISVPNKQLQSKIEFNLALTEEMKGNIDLAVKWGAKSLKSNNSLSTKKYLKELRQLSRQNNFVNYSYYYEPQSMIPWTLGGREE